MNLAHLSNHVRTREEQMERYIFETKEEMGRAAAECGAKAIRDATFSKVIANIILATGASQFEMLNHLTQHPDVRWGKVSMFHLDEYIGISIEHPASFCKYLQERFVDKVPSLMNAYWVNGDVEDPREECKRLNTIIAAHPIDVAMVGIGENGHLAFNDPPADFDTETPYIVVDLDKKCREQQLGEGWFETLDDVPKQAISMGIKQIMKSKKLIVTVPDERKAIAVRDALEGEVTNTCPASILQTHTDCKIFLDKSAASLLTQ